jgi:hypothetical protein
MEMAATAAARSIGVVRMLAPVAANILVVVHTLAVVRTLVVVRTLAAVHLSLLVRTLAAVVTVRT